MPYSDMYLYSPLSIKTVHESQNKALLLQFILSELFHTLDAEKKDDPLEFVFSSPACFFPYDWSYEVGCLNKISEHANLLKFAFPNYEVEMDFFKGRLDNILTKVIENKKLKKTLLKKELKSDLNSLYTALHPFLIACKKSEELLLFLLKHEEEVESVSKRGALRSLFEKMFLDGHAKVAKLVKDEYHRRGFETLAKEFEKHEI